MPVTIRAFQPEDANSIVDILKKNGQFDHPNVEGPEAMERVSNCNSAVFLIAEKDSAIVGCIRATYDGSRAMIHLLSVLPENQFQHIGTSLVNSAIAELSLRGAPTTSVTVTTSSEDFWAKLGFEKLPVYLMLKSNHK
jgi:N-acetylglutamate synthase-like GNAT family acetyltransferase